jgi:OOP family OmpA-OmpF porin
MSGRSFGLIVLVGFFLLMFLAVRMGTASIETDIETRANGLLAANGLTDVVVVASGTDVELTGAIGDGYAQDDVFAAVALLQGVTSVEGQLWLVSEIELEDIVVVGDPIEFKWDAFAVTIVGNISNQERKDFIYETMTESFSSVNVDGLVVLEDLADESDWIGSVLSLVISTQDPIESGRVIVFPGEELLVLAGEVDDTTLRNSLNEQVSEVAASIGFLANPAIRVPDVVPTLREVEALQEVIDELILDQVVEFQVQSAVLTPVGITLLDELLAKLRTAPEIRVAISGHADSQGSAESNLTLSMVRAQAVANYLVANGESPDRFDILWYGETQPKVSNDTPEGRAANRRIEFRAILEEAE